MDRVTMSMRIVPEPVPADDDDVILALETARVSEEREDVEAAIKWLHRAAAAARRQGRPERAGALSRSAAQLGGVSEKFERRIDPPQVFGEIAEDDFSEQTIVESAAEIAAKTEATDTDSESTETDIQEVPLRSPTPVAPFLVQPKGRDPLSVRVAVKKLLGGRYEARTLLGDDVLGPGEHEALLVPVHRGSKL